MAVGGTCGQNGRREVGLHNRDMGPEDRKKGHLRHRWAQLFKATVGPEWTIIARNRELWREKWLNVK